MDEETHQRVRERIQGRPLESWYSMYRILFPGDDLPSTPLAEWVVGEDLRSCFQMLAQTLPRLLYSVAVQREAVSGNVQQTLHTPFPTTADVIHRALLRCQREFGRATGLTHVFEHGPPPFAESARNTSGRPSQTSSPTQSRHSRGVSEADEYEAHGRPLAPQQRYVNAASNVQPSYPSMPYTSAGYHPATTAPTDEGSYDALNLMEDMYEEYGMAEDDY